MRTLTELVASMASTRPDSTALVGLTESLTWADFDAAVAGLAAGLVAAGVEPGDRVAVCLPKDAFAYVAMHGAMRAGAIAVPVDPLAPAVAAREVLADARISGMIGGTSQLAKLDPWSLPELDLRVVVGDGPCADPRVTTRADLPARGAATLPTVAADDPAYIIYTSGSTGRPKGILHTHRSALAYAERAARCHEITATDRVAGMSPFHFDMSTLELYAAPLVGAAVVVMDEAHARFPASFTARSAEHQVSVWYSVPALFRQLVARGELASRELGSLRLIMYGGEPYSGAALAELMRALPAVIVKNIYGPAEVNECTNHLVATPPASDEEIPIGRPWDGVDLRVVDDDGRAVPPGQPGELWVAAPTMMAGYWNQPEATAQSLRVGDRPWYATGDIVVEDEAGCYWFRGRRDHQVKIRGVRIELEAVENVLGDAPDVLHAVVAPVKTADGTAQLVAVVVAAVGVDGETLGALRSWCAARLPQTAVPRAIVAVPDLPRTPSGKIDRRRVREAVAHHGLDAAAELLEGSVP